ncbi:hypothetical protein [Penaeicola halotolerans]|uniref:hypothetical protein n=1 Tax=Penaeicola halotolerans TaxID=2793196 RepID=UPI001CF88E6A|nr:hypothetical protein [Penaeicola halotolerans]
MPVINNYREAWLAKANIDYFAPFISLWLACNSWYRSHYSDLTASNNPEKEGTDRDFINKLKTDFTRRNHLYKNFEDALLGSDEKKKVSFKTNMELLLFSLNRAELQPERLVQKCSFEYFLTDYSLKDNPQSYVNIIATPRINKDNTVHKDDAENVIKLDTKYIVNDIKIVFAGLIELIYQIRNMVIHGHVKPEKDEHDVIKYCYLILNDMMGA